MEKRICSKCLNEFEITDSEIDFYSSKGLNLPKKCKSCRQESKNAKERKTNKNNNFVILVACCILLFVMLWMNGLYAYSLVPAAVGAVTVIAKFCGFISLNRKMSKTNLAAISKKYTYSFSNTDTFKEHFEKHGAETNSKTPEEYLKKANEVIKSKKSLVKHEKEDGDKIFFNPDTCEIVFLSKKYEKIRTYYVSDWAYFNRQ